ncbi:unnamed protein product [Trichogramma brassicae]|uniref:Uncharacterized protein n=1 Tax=Trichogramma brassicae TaxID=86971 RepID=A0A6H5J1X2_9HYME|nr:unnamed protein product [Trichogramma brassicae]
MVLPDSKISATAALAACSRLKRLTRDQTATYAFVTLRTSNHYGFTETYAESFAYLSRRKTQASEPRNSRIVAQLTVGSLKKPPVHGNWARVLILNSGGDASLGYHAENGLRSGTTTIERWHRADRYQAELLKRASHSLDGRVKMVFDLPQVLGQGPQGDVVCEADDLNVASEVKAQKGVEEPVSMSESFRRSYRWLWVLSWCDRGDQNIELCIP